MPAGDQDVDVAGEGRVAVGVQAAYDAVGRAYNSQLRDELDGFLLDPAEVASELESAGWTVTAEVKRQPYPGVEYPSRRCYLLAQRL